MARGDVQVLIISPFLKFYFQCREVIVTKGIVVPKK